MSGLTLQLSADIETLDNACEQEQAEIDRTRESELAAIPKAVAILNRYHQAIAKARKQQIARRLDAERTRDKTVRAIEDRRRRLLSSEERAYRRDRDKAYGKKRDSQKKARDRWLKELRRLNNQPLEDQRRLRRVADQRYDEDLQKASDTFNSAVDQARLEHRSALQDALIEERLAVEQSHRHTEKQITGAAIEFERQQASEEATLRAELKHIPEASDIQKQHDREMAGVRESCEARKELLFREFSKNRRKLTE